MNTQILIIAAIVIAFVILIAIIVVAIMRSSKGGESVGVASQKPKSKELTLQDLIDIANDRNSDKNELFTALKIFSNSFIIPPKNGNNAPPEAKAYLRFISALASNPHADAKLIAFMNSELIKRNPQYAQEIDAYEKSGLSKRH